MSLTICRTDLRGRTSPRASLLPAFAGLIVMSAAGGAVAQDVVLKCQWAPAQGEQMSSSGGETYYRVGPTSWQRFDAGRWVPMPCTTGITPFDAAEVMGPNDPRTLECTASSSDVEYRWQLSGRHHRVIDGTYYSGSFATEVYIIDRTSGQIHSSFVQEQEFRSGTKLRQSLSMAGSCELAPEPIAPQPLF
jgi:hypothetical protein